MSLQVPYSKKAPAGGYYRLCLSSGALTVVGAAGVVFSFRWSSTSMRCVVQSIALKWGSETAFGTAQALYHSVYVARSFTVSDSGGLTITTTQVKDQALDTTFPQSNFFAGNGDIRISNASALAAGTRTLDDQPIYTFIGYGGTVGMVATPVPLLLGNEDATHPLVLRNNEGFVITNDTVMGAAGVIRLVVCVEWLEINNSYT